MAEGWQRDAFEDLLEVSHEESPGSRRLLVGASVAMGDESAQGGLGVLSSAAAAVAGRGARRETTKVSSLWSAPKNQPTLNWVRWDSPLISRKLTEAHVRQCLGTSNANFKGE